MVKRVNEAKEKIEELQTELDQLRSPNLGITPDKKVKSKMSQLKKSLIVATPKPAPNND